MSDHKSAGVGDPAAAAETFERSLLKLLLLLLRNLESPQLGPLVASLNHAPQPCQMELCFVARLEPARMRWCICDKCC